MTPDPYRPVDTDEVLRRVDVHARVGAELLGGGGVHASDDTAFAGELAVAARNAAEHELADVAYDLARACLAVHGACCRNSIWIESPAHVLDLHRAIRLLSQRLDPETAQLKLPQPGSESDLRPLRAALRICEGLEGRSDRVRYMEAVLPAVHEQWDETASRARDLANSTATPSWRRTARLLIVHALTEAGQSHRALTEIDSLALDDGEDPILAFDRCAAHANLGNTDSFLSAASVFRATLGEGAWANEWSQLVHNRISWFAQKLNVEACIIQGAFGLEASA
ncbi:MAG: hypothetical protein DHS20C15_19470 [Planctomycetota bacterium]|nr:MAG: hypothetical protein DHS20C15_19470 [Planctomycetota bacterium]